MAKTLKNAEDIRVGDVVRCRVSADDPWRRVTKIEPYSGPLKDTVFATAETVSGGFSLCRGQAWEVDG